MANSQESFNPFLRQNFKVLGVNDNGNVLIHVEDVSKFHKFNSGVIELMDKRNITNDQRRMVWSLIGAIAEWQGESKSSTMKTMINEAMKLDFLEASNESPSRMFSLSDAPISTVCEYQKFLVDFILDNDIPTKNPLYTYVDDYSRYIYKCLMTKKCCICGLKSDLHHCNIDGSRIGMGRDRQTIIHEGLSVLPLCREHHTEIHTMPEQEFFDKYHIEKPIHMDKELCKFYGVKAFAE